MTENLSSSDRSAALIKALRSLQFCRDFELEAELCTKVPTHAHVAAQRKGL